MSDNGVIIAASAMKSMIKDVQGGPEAQFKEAVRVVMDNFDWVFSGSMQSIEDQAFRACAGALLLVCSDEDKERVKYELTVLRSLSSASQGIPVDFERLFRDDIAPLGLMGIWRENRPKEFKDGV